MSRRVGSNQYRTREGADQAPIPDHDLLTQAQPTRRCGEVWGHPVYAPDWTHGKHGNEVDQV
jgi:hypothetical protein